ncbi:cytochrome c oxidase subunit NDUFA4-like [Tubulanus polymorphus]|uniref:cytochrome c oxidase subunit NDUFA4-like n=1 Tax=Tubulanus polymorphus TaxID=672921 RepID=UPI003DA39C9F
MQGLSWASLKKHPSLMPLFVCVGVGMAGAGMYLARLAIRNPDVSWDKKKNPNPNEQYAGKQYKFYSPVRDYSKEKYPDERPKLE